MRAIRRDLRQILFLVLTRLAVKGTVLALNEDGVLTSCQRCCIPGGDCSKAFKGGPGKCCGNINGQSFCCPGVPGFSGAKCYNCGHSYRCFTGTSARSVCGPAAPRARHSHVQAGHSTTAMAGDAGMYIVIALIIVGLVLCYARPRVHSQAPGYTWNTDSSPMYSKPNVACGMPVAPQQGLYHPHQGCMPMPYGHGAPGFGHGYDGGGYSGGAVAGSAAAGFVGGMLVGEMLDSHHNHSSEVHHYHHDSYGGDFEGNGGGDFGGDDGGFDADS